jgi:hypothetical protein
VTSSSGAKLFDEFDRSDSAHKREGESVFQFMNRVDRPDWARVRDELDNWYSLYPDSGDDLRKRFRSRREDQHFGAWWELWIHTFYRRLGYSVDVHPDLPNGTNPDFLISREGLSTYVECKAIPEKSRSADEGRIIDCTNEVKHRDFLLELEIDQQGTQTPSCNAIRTQVEKQLRALNADDAISDREAGKDFPSFQVSVQDWLLTYTAYPVDPDRRGDRGRLLALPPSPGAVWIDNVGLIRRALADKGRKYAKLEKPLENPLVVAINTWWVPMDDEDEEVFEALFGSPAFTYWQGMRPPSIHAFRKENGYWRHEPPAGTRVSAVLMGHNIDPWHAATDIPRMWINPWAPMPISETCGLATATANDDGQPICTEGTRTAHDVFGLPAGWPTIA